MQQANEIKSVGEALIGLESLESRSLQSQERGIIQTRISRQGNIGDDTIQDLQDNGTGVYIGHLDKAKKIKEGVGVRLYLKEQLQEDKVL